MFVLEQSWRGFTSGALQRLHGDWQLLTAVLDNTVSSGAVSEILSPISYETDYSTRYELIKPGCSQQSAELGLGHTMEPSKSFSGVFSPSGPTLRPLCSRLGAGVQGLRSDLKEWQTIEAKVDLISKQSVVSGGADLIPADMRRTQQANGPATESPPNPGSTLRQDQPVPEFHSGRSTSPGLRCNSGAERAEEERDVIAKMRGQAVDKAVKLCGARCLKMSLLDGAGGSWRELLTGSQEPQPTGSV
ncbi:hypothetical protein RRG08_031339 [Elysia crispata]|uniref:Uncharacterized protein n=1 Tax=Elysia crispata TaxID=231223 RepID=A0AAE0YI40_9GAST|nr:hypothetical protein RRG08_031339 [Elysia crispata]